MPNYDVFVYHDVSDDTGAQFRVGDQANKFFGRADQHIVAIGPPVHEGKDATVVIAHGSEPMRDVQALLDSQRRGSGSSG